MGAMPPNPHQGWIKLINAAPLGNPLAFIVGEPPLWRKNLNNG